MVSVSGDAKAVMKVVLSVLSMAGRWAEWRVFQ